MKMSEVQGLSAMINKEVFDALLSAYFQEISLLSPQQELYLTSMILEDDSVQIEADIVEDTLQ